jgi:adenylate cyclase class IV
VTVDKTREEWKLPDVAIAFDHVEGTGHVVEPELRSEERNATSHSFSDGNVTFLSHQRRVTRK